MTYSSLTLYIKYYKIGKYEPQSLARAMCVLAVYNKAQAQRISNREFNLWTFLQGTESKQKQKANHLQPWSLGVEHPSQITAVVRMFILII